jgi:cephalosporin hydroxylase
MDLTMGIDPLLLAQRAKSLMDFSPYSKLSRLSGEWREEAMKTSYVYNFDWLGRPIIQFPQDIVGLQEIIWEVKPDLIIETGVAHGGSLVLSASILALLDIEDGRIFDSSRKNRRVLGIDIDIRDHNRIEIESHFLSSWITLLEGSSTDTNLVDEVSSLAKGYKNVMVLLDSNHTYAHVLEELNAYSKLVSLNSYLIVYDTFVHFVPKDTFQNRPWGPDDNPFLAVQEFLSSRDDFIIDKDVEHKLQITVAPSGFLKRIRV